MKNNKKILALIPARGGSKRVKNKNIKDFCGKPLIVWTIETALKSKYIDEVILSSEDEKIIDVAKKYGCSVPFVRPKELSLDETPGIEPIIHAIENYKGFDYLILLQTTSPLRTVQDIDNCIELCFANNAKSCISVAEVTQNPHWMYSLDADKQMDKFISSNDIARSQDLPKLYSLNGAIYMNKISNLLKTKKLINDNSIGYVMSEENSIDIDTEKDFKLAQFYINEKLKNNINREL